MLSWSIIRQQSFPMASWCMDQQQNELGKNGNAERKSFRTFLKNASIASFLLTKCYQFQ